MKQTQPKKTEKKKGGTSGQWVLTVFCMAVGLSAVLSLASEFVMDGAGVAVALLILALFIGLGIVFDVIGVAVTAADARPFHSMAAHKEKGASEALSLLRNASHVSSFCNDVVGDICGIVSGTTAAVIVTRLHQAFSINGLVLSVGLTALISGLTIGGKALGKNFAIQNSTGVVFTVAKVLHMFHRR